MGRNERTTIPTTQQVLKPCKASMIYRLSIIVSHNQLSMEHKQYIFKQTCLFMPNLAEMKRPTNREKLITG